MKRVILWTLSVLCLVGCAVHEVETEHVEYIYSVALEDGSADSLSIELSFEWPLKGLPPVALENMQRGLASALFGKEMTSTDIHNISSEYAQKETDSYRENSGSLREMVVRNGGDPVPGMFSWSRILEGHFLEPYNGMQSYLIYTYGYSGGAHGLDSEQGMTFSLSNGKTVTEEDLFRRDYKAELSRILTENLPKSVTKDVYDMIFIKNIEPNGNFYVDSDGVTYIYERYEIGPYVSGLVRVSIPWNELTDILK